MADQYPTTMDNSKLLNLPIEDIVLDRSNPRIKHFLEIYAGEITADSIALALSNSSSSGERQMSFSALRDSIRTSKGIIHPIIVNLEPDGTYVAIEGNTRLYIYKEFYTETGDSIWSRIPAMVYHGLTPLEKHEIRLQSHLVGPRECDPYSKAKYLWELSTLEHMPMDQLVDLCGGRKTEIRKSIDTYVYMEDHYRTYVDKHGYDFEPRSFSKFQEFLTPVVRRSITRQGFDESKFAEWVAEGNVDKALGVRELPDIMANPEARTVFLKKNLSEAEKVVNAARQTKTDLSKYPMETLLRALRQKVDALDYDEITCMARGEDADASRTVHHLKLLKRITDFVLEQIETAE